MLGFVSLFMDTLSDLIHALLPIFLVTTLGATTLMVGIIEGIAEAATPITKVFSGAIGQEHAAQCRRLRHRDGARDEASGPTRQSEGRDASAHDPQSD